MRALFARLRLGEFLLGRRLPGLSIIEVSVVLIILGVMMGAVLKGRALIEGARINQAAQNVRAYQSAFQTFFDTYGAMPGDFSGGSSLFGDSVGNGNGNGIIDGKFYEDQTDGSLVWDHLHKSGLVQRVDKKSWHGHSYPSTPLGGGFFVESNPFNFQGVWLIISRISAQGYGGLLTPRQASLLRKKIGEDQSKAYNVETGGDCTLEEGQNQGRKACIVLALLEE